MKKIFGIISVLFIASGLLFISCSKQDTEPKVERAAEKGVYSEKAGEMMETAKETVSGYAENAEEAVESAKETVTEYGEKAKEKATEYTEQAKERVYGYTAPEKEAAETAGEKTGETME